MYALLNVPGAIPLVKGFSYCCQQLHLFFVQLHTLSDHYRRPMSILRPDAQFCKIIISRVKTTKICVRERERDKEIFLFICLFDIPPKSLTYLSVQILPGNLSRKAAVEFNVSSPFHATAHLFLVKEQEGIN